MRNPLMEMFYITLAVFFCVALGAACGYFYAHDAAQEQVTEISRQHADALGKANKALDEANARAKALETRWNLETRALAAQYEERTTREKVISDRESADLRAQLKRLQVRTTIATASGGQLCSAGGGTGERNEAPVQTLAPAVAGRLNDRYAERNEVVDQLTTCQDILAAERRQK